MDQFQFFPTPEDLAQRMWSKFENRKFDRVLEPTAGEGHLALENPVAKRNYSSHSNRITIDCCEIDLSKHIVLKGHGFNVIGLDFMALKSGSIYSHVIANFPFAKGAEMALHAWEIVWDAELVILLNAETIRNPYSAKRQQLVRLIDEFGEVEFIQDAFKGASVEIEAEVEVALVYLRKKASHDNIVGNLFSELREDHRNGESLAREFVEANALAVPETEIENRVLAFNAAVRATKESVLAAAKASYYGSFLGAKMAERLGEPGTVSQEGRIEWIRKEMGDRYDDLKDRAWTSILSTSQVKDRLSSQAARRLESEFATIKRLEFTVENIYGFLLGLVQSQGKIQIEMMCDVFDSVTRYSTDNAVYYRGWKSNDQHRSCGKRIKMKRFIIPGHSTDSYDRSFSYKTEQYLRDLDKVMALLDSKFEPEYGLVEAARDNFKALQHGARIQSSYFELRHYPGVGTLHFFPRDPKLIDRLNRWVGQHRQWLPADVTEAPEEFWSQFDKAEKFDAEFRKELATESTGRWWQSPVDRLGWASTDEGRITAEQAVDRALGRVQKRHGIDLDHQLEHKKQHQEMAQLPLLEAA